MSYNFEIESGKTVKLPTAGKYCDRDIVVAGFGSNEADLQAKYDEGRVDGLDEGAAICAAQHFVHNLLGDGTDKISFHTPFEPDALYVFGIDPTVLNTGCAISLLYDRRALGQCAGYVGYGNESGGMRFTMFSDAKAALRYSRADDGMVTVTGVGTSNAVVPFGAGFPYTVIGVKYTQQTDKERITAFVNRLTGSGTVSIQRAKVEAAFTDDEWAALIATKPDWTFTLI